MLNFYLIIYLSILSSVDLVSFWLPSDQPRTVTVAVKSIHTVAVFWHDIPKQKRLQKCRLFPSVFYYTTFKKKNYAKWTVTTVDWLFCRSSFEVIFTWSYSCTTAVLSQGHPRTCHKGPDGTKRHSFTPPATSALNAKPRPLYPRGKRRGTHCTGGLVDTRAVLDEWGKSRPHQDPIPRPSGS